MLESLRRSIVTEEELFQALSCKEYASYHDRVLLLVAQHRLAPVKSSGLNGRVPPLYRKYRIVRSKIETPDVSPEIKALHPSLSIERYLEKPGMYVIHRDLLQPISDALWKQPEWWRARMSLNEKSFALYGDEKRMARERMRLEGILVFNRLDWSLFGIYETPEPFFSWNLPGDATEGKPHVVLVLENKDIWYSLTDLAESMGAQTLFNERMTCLIYGEGNKVNRERGSLASYLDRMFGGMDAYQAYYCGDLDAEGVRIWWRLKQANPELRLALFHPIYREMVRWATDRAEDGTGQLPPSADEREMAHLSEEEWMAFLLEACNPDGLESAEGPGSTERPESAEGPGSTESPESAERPGSTESPESAERPESAESPESADIHTDLLRVLSRALATGGRIPQEAVNRTVLARMLANAAKEAKEVPCP